MKAATWLSPVLPMADRNLQSPGGCSTRQVRASQWAVMITSVSLSARILWLSCDVSLILSKMHLSKGSWETQPLLWMRTRVGSQPTYVEICGGNKCGLLYERESECVTALWLTETLMTTSRCEDRATLMENSSIFINYCVKHQRFRHISSPPSVSCTWKLSHMDGCALPSLSVCIRGEPFVCFNPLSHMVA